MIRRWLLPLIIGLVSAGIAWQVTLAMTPRALMSLAVARVARGGGYNHFFHAPIVTAASRAIVRPSPDLLYSSCPFDLADAPLLIDVAPIDAPYWSLSVFDRHTDTAFVGNNVASGNRPLRIAVARLGQAVPPGYRIVTVDGNRGIALLRILIDREAPIDAIDRQRRATRCAASP